MYGGSLREFEGRVDVIIFKVAGRLSLSILAGTLSKPGALIEGRFKIIFATSFSDTG